MNKNEFEEKIFYLTNHHASEFSEILMHLDSAIEKNDWGLSKSLLKKIYQKSISYYNEISKQLKELLKEIEHLAAECEKIKQEKNRFEKLYLTGLIFQSEREMIALMEKAIEILVKELNADNGFIILVDDKQNITRIVTNNVDENCTNKAKELSITVINKALQDLKPLKLNDIQKEEEFSRRHSIVSLGLNSVMCVPLLSADCVLGAVYVDRRKENNPFKEEDLIFLISFAKQVVKGIEISSEILALEEKLEDKPKLEYEKLKQQFKCNEIIGKSIKLFNVLKLASKVADSDASILILGENGTGKEILARAIHNNSSRKDKPFIALNCGAIPNELLESELFGYESGAFTGAVKSKPGRLELADGGTIFLDEIAEMNVNLQAKLLRVIQTKEIERLGGIHPKKIDVRFISATNKDLTKLIAEKLFREDLYYRLKVVEIRIPPLRERKEDIEELVRFFIEKYKGNKGNFLITDEALNILENYNWPGNIRELENVIQRAIILADSNVIQKKDLPQEIIDEYSLNNYAKSLSEAEDDFRRYYITKVLRQTGSKTDAAKLLGINRSHLHKLISQLGIIE
ncbi:MAG: sigma-54-dependent Fis family transcriptional regulator [Melioribacter sp.]|nr:sigma-54-dependent Fis family transcriptional regulator [Melioribacter sp.]